MRADEPFTADWEDAAVYAPLLDADRSLFAWEWLRRDVGYRAAARQALGSTEAAPAARPQSWGLHAFENPDLPAPDARPIWRAAVHPYVLAARAGRSGAAPDRFDLARFGPLAHVFTDEAGSEHLLLSDGHRAIRIDVLAGGLSSGPRELRYLLGGLGAAEKPLLTLRRLLALARTGRFSRALHAREARARRWVLVLRANDGLAAGADQREIATLLLSRSASEPRWRDSAPSVRSQAQRLVRAARQMAAGGYRELLQ